MTLLKEPTELDIQNQIELFKTQYDSEIEEYGPDMAKDLAVALIDYWMWKYKGMVGEYNVVYKELEWIKAGCPAS